MRAATRWRSQEPDCTRKASASSFRRRLLDGEITFQIDGKRTIAKAGTALYARRLIVHTFQNFGRATAHMLVVVAPAGLERLFEEMSAAFDSKPAPDRTKLVALNKKYGITILGPPLTAQPLDTRFCAAAQV
jgi:hypothetical protein